MQVVKFKNGLYGIRKKVFGGFKFYDFTLEHWWGNDYYMKYRKDCQTIEQSKAEKTLEHLNDMGEPV